MTTISEHGFTVELPGQWVADPDPEPGGLVYKQLVGDGVLTAMLLSVSPLSDTKDTQELLTRYIEHRGQAEQARMPGLVQFEEEISQRDDGTIEALWSGESTDGTYHQLHRTILYDDVLLDVCVGGLAPEHQVFEVAAVLVLSSAGFEPEAGADGE